MNKTSCVCLWCNARTLMMRDKTLTTVHAMNCRMYKGGMTMEELKQYDEDFEEIKVFYKKISNE